MQYVIVGAGSLGTVFGAYLALAGQEVTLLARRTIYEDAVRRHGGVVLNSPDGGRQTVPVRVTADPKAVGSADALIFLTKSYSTREAAQSVAAAAGDLTLAVTVQNGLGNDRALAEVFGAERVVPGTTTVGAVLEEPGVVSLTPASADGTTMTTLGHPRSGVVPPAIDKMAAELTAARLPTEVRDDADVVTWTQLATAAPIAPLSALLRQRVSTIFGDEATFSLVKQMFDEVLAVASAKGIPLERDLVWAHTTRAWSAAGGHVPSITQDLLAQRQLEIEALCLELVRQAREAGVDTPTLETVGRLVTATERHYGDELARVIDQSR